MNIIDIRSNSKYNLGHIHGAVNIDSYELINNTNKYLRKDEKYYICCDSGVSSKRVVSILNNMGYNTVNIEGGYKNYLLRK